MQKACLGLQVSLEGMEGSGTPFLLTLLQEFLQEAFPDQLVTVVEERQERLGPAFEQNLWRTLLAHTDRVGRGGAPRAETLVRLALLASDAQQLIEPVVAAGQIVLVDRGIDTFVVQHTRHLFPDVPEARLLVEATHLYTLACQWRRPPDLTFWLLDDFSTTVRRAQERAAETYRPTDLAWLRRLSDFSHAYVREHHERITLLDRRVLSNEEIVTTIQQALRAIPCHRKSTRSDGRDDTVIPERQTKEDDRNEILNPNEQNVLLWLVSEHLSARKEYVSWEHPDIIVLMALQQKLRDAQGSEASALPLDATAIEEALAHLNRLDQQREGVWAKPSSEWYAVAARLINQGISIRRPPEGDIRRGEILS